MIFCCHSKSSVTAASHWNSAHEFKCMGEAPVANALYHLHLILAVFWKKLSIFYHPHWNILWPNKISFICLSLVCFWYDTWVCFYFLLSHHWIDWGGLEAFLADMYKCSLFHLLLLYTILLFLYIAPSIIGEASVSIDVRHHVWCGG